MGVFPLPALDHKEESGLGKPSADFEIDAALVRELLVDQHADLALEPIEEIAAGWDNAMFTLGKGLAARLPRRAAAAALIVHEQIWLPRLAPSLTLPVPVPVWVGVPGRGYPWRWSVAPFLPGRPAARSGLHPEHARPFAEFLSSLHQPAPADAPANPFRGVPLAERAESGAARMAGVARETDLITPTIRRLWADALDAPAASARLWLHGDLHPGNVLVEGNAISGIIDWGDVTAGDVATDLAAIWMLFDEPCARAAAFAAYPALDDPTRTRARGWAILFGVTLFAAGRADQSGFEEIGQRILRRLQSD